MGRVCLTSFPFFFRFRKCIWKQELSGVYIAPEDGTLSKMCSEPLSISLHCCV